MDDIDVRHKRMKPYEPLAHSQSSQDPTFDICKLGDNPTAQFHESHNCFMIAVTSERSFTMKSVTVPDGTYQGQEVLIMKPAPPFPFLKLPVEIRLAIYGGVLGHEKRISIDSVNGGFYANKFHGKHRLAILSVNKQIQAEALPELYRGRTFCFGDPSSLAKFFHRSGVSAKRVEAIDLLWAFLTRRTMRRLSGGLAKCQILKRVRVSIGIDGDGEQPELEEMVAKGLRPWLLSGSKEKVINDEHLEATEIWYSNVDEEDEEVPGDFRARVLECL